MSPPFVFTGGYKGRLANITLLYPFRPTKPQYPQKTVISSLV